MFGNLEKVCIFALANEEMTRRVSEGTDFFIGIRYITPHSVSCHLPQGSIECG